MQYVFFDLLSSRMAPSWPTYFEHLSMTTSGAPLQKTRTVAPPLIQIATVARLREELKGIVKILFDLLEA